MERETKIIQGFLEIFRKRLEGCEKNDPEYYHYQGRCMGLQDSLIAMGIDTPDSKRIRRGVNNEFS